MRVGRVLPLLVVAGASCGAGVALASHPQVDPKTVPVGFLTAHSTVNRIPASVVARALRSGKADVFIEHGRLPANQSVDYHVHPGPSFITVQEGTLNYEEAADERCVRKSYGKGQGFVDGPSRHVHRVTAGAFGADYYEVYLLPRRTGPHFAKAAQPDACL
jgi:hypothetical protein